MAGSVQFIGSLKKNLWDHILDDFKKTLRQRTYNVNDREIQLALQECRTTNNNLAPLLEAYVLTVLTSNVSDDDKDKLFGKLRLTAGDGIADLSELRNFTHLYKANGQYVSVQVNNIVKKYLDYDKHRLFFKVVEQILHGHQNKTLIAVIKKVISSVHFILKHLLYVNILTDEYNKVFSYFLNASDYETAVATFVQENRLYMLPPPRDVNKKLEASNYISRLGEGSQIFNTKLGGEYSFNTFRAWFWHYYLENEDLPQNLSDSYDRLIEEAKQIIAQPFHKTKKDRDDVYYGQNWTRVVICKHGNTKQILYIGNTFPENLGGTPSAMEIFSNYEHHAVTKISQIFNGIKNAAKNKALKTTQNFNYHWSGSTSEILKSAVVYRCFRDGILMSSLDSVVAHVVKHPTYRVDPRNVMAGIRRLVNNYFNYGMECILQSTTVVAKVSQYKVTINFEQMPSGINPSDRRPPTNNPPDPDVVVIDCSENDSLEFTTFYYDDESVLE